MFKSKQKKLFPRLNFSPIEDIILRDWLNQYPISTKYTGNLYTQLEFGFFKEAREEQERLEREQMQMGGVIFTRDDTIYESAA